MSMDFFANLSEHEKEMYQKYKNGNSADFTASNNKKCIVSPLNDRITFNPFQYEPYYKLSKQAEYPKAIYIADEVGAGKTIETGIILTELIFQKEINLREDVCLIICPNLLCRKWKNTLAELFGLSASIIYSLNNVLSGINILSYDTISNFEGEITVEPKLLVLDEAHNASGDRYDKLFSIRKNVREKGFVILLSATPLNGTDEDVCRQRALVNEKLKIENFFDTDSEYLCRNKKLCMRYALNPEKYRVETVINNHFIENVELLNFKAAWEDFFDGWNTLQEFQGMNMLMSSPEAGIIFLDNFLNKENSELLEYLNSKGNNEDPDDESDDDESEDDESDDDESGGARHREYSLEDVIKMKEKFGEIRARLDGIRKKEREDRKFEELLKVIKDNQIKINENADGEGEFYRHIIVFTDRVSTAKYLEDQLKEQTTVPCDVFRVTGELFETEKRARLVQYENANEKMSILIITNVACEGQDMDYGNTIVNYDLDYNPVRLEQRRGRVDRFEVKKNKIFIHNFMIDQFDFDPQNSDKPFDPYSKVYKIWDKIQKIKKTTGSYYEILDNAKETSADEEELRLIKQNVFGHCIELAGGIAGSTNKKIEELKEIVLTSCLKQFGEYENIYDLISDRMKNSDVRIEKGKDKDQIVICTKKDNQEFLKNIYCGGTLISHLVLGGK